MQFKRPQLVIGILIVAVVGLVTMILQLENWVNVLANVSEIYLFGIMLPTLSFAFALISRDFTKKDPSGSTNPVTTTVEQKSIEMMINVNACIVVADKLQKIHHVIRIQLVRIRLVGPMDIQQWKW